MADDRALVREVAVLLTKILHEEVDPDLPDAGLDDDYGANSMDMVEIVESMERNYGVKIANDQIPAIRTLGDLLRLIHAKC